MSRRRNKAPAPTVPTLTVIDGGLAAASRANDPIEAVVNVTLASLSIWACCFDFWAEQVRQFRDEALQVSRLFKDGAPT